MRYSADPDILRNQDHAQLAWAAIEPIWDNLPYGRFGPLSRFMLDLTQGQRGLIALDWCQKEIRNGGMRQLFANSTGNLVPWAVDGFRLIGADRYADILREAAAMLGTEYPTSRRGRMAALSALQATQRARLGELEGEFLDLISSHEHDLEPLRGQYVRRNPGQFLRDPRSAKSNGE